MKRALNILILIWFFAFPGTSQVNLPFPDSTGAWVMTDVAYGSPWDPDYWYSYRHFVGNETTINGKTYRELKYGHFDINNFQNASIVGHYRIDSLQVYFRFADQMNPNIYGCYLDTGDILLYDFDLQPADTFYLAEIGGQSTYIILDSIDSINYNGNYYRRFNFNPYNYYTYELPYYWVEGIGSAEGFFPFFYYFEADHFFHCFHSNGETFEFELGGASDCFSIPLGVEELNNNQRELIKIIDVSGRETKEKPNTLLIYIYSDGTTEKVYRVE